MKKVSTVDEYYETKLKYTTELKKLRKIFLKSGLTESLKWGAPTYHYENENILATCEFKTYFGVWFYQGALLTDPENKLINAAPEKTKALRQWRMNDMTDIDEAQILRFIYEAIENHKNGRKIGPEKNKPLEIPEVLKQFLKNNKSHSLKFESFNLTRRREFCEYIESAKRMETKHARLSKIAQMINEGIGLHDKYR